MKILMILFLKN